MTCSLNRSLIPSVTGTHFSSKICSPAAACARWKAAWYALPCEAMMRRGSTRRYERVLQASSPQQHRNKDRDVTKLLEATPLVPPSSPLSSPPPPRFPLHCRWAAHLSLGVSHVRSTRGPLGRPPTLSSSLCYSPYPPARQLAACLPSSMPGWPARKTATQPASIISHCVSQSATATAFIT